MFSRSLLVCLVMVTVGAVAQQSAIEPHSGYEPPMAKAAASLAASTAGVKPELLTTGEKTDWNQTGRYDEVVTLIHRMEKMSPYIKVVQFGTTPEGRPMEAVIVSSDKAFTPEAAAKTDKAVILIQSGIHSGEIEGKDTVLMLIRDMAITKRPEQAAWLNKAIFVVVPVFNIDGHESVGMFNRANQNGPKETGTRAQAQQLNLNRDYIKGDAPEMRAWLKLYNSWMPDFMFDNHVTDGADYQYDVTWDMAHNQDMAEPTRAWINDKYIPQINKRMSEDGHMVSPYGALRGGGTAARRGGDNGEARPNNTPSGRREFYIEVFSPRYSHLYAAAQNRPCLLVETHSLKSAKTRAWANYDIMKHSIEIVTEDPQALRKAVRESDKEMAARAGDRNAAPVYLAGKTSEKSKPLVYHSLKIAPFKSEVTGAMTPRYTAEKDDFETVIHEDIDTTEEAKMPLGYLIPLAWKDLADELSLHGVKMERTTKPLEQEFETYRFSDVKYSNAAFEGRVMVDFTTAPVKEKILIPAGSYWVPMNQQKARLILSMLDPHAPDSLIRWGFCNAIFQGTGRIGAREYLTEPIARKMMAESPELRTEFEAKVAQDAKFAADPQARLTWWIERSNYQPPVSNRYPVVEVWNKSW
jgi:murein tripeptide amidase MpaA